ncbi:hypothetical protein E3N88_34450 [Mikania micrantha]|uniref:Uncharacterized protein n=1 Tax=Mikania micrantha TaxID=192012 RepID=A0A5N6LY60_9ASTR|nr:hypothetical protein E3N88_34450 [Mikania micrantha]
MGAMSTASCSREVMLEKQLTGHRVHRSICAWFWEQSLSQPDSFKPTDLEKDPKPCVHFSSFKLNGAAQHQVPRVFVVEIAIVGKN